MQLKEWRSANKPVALARVTETWGSSPRPVGSAMLITSKLEMIGSVSGGCVEGAVLRQVNPILDARESKLLSFGVADEDAWAVGLSCGGKLSVFLQPWNSDTVSKVVEDNLSQNKGCVLVTRIADGAPANTVIENGTIIAGDTLSDRLISEAVDAYAKRAHRMVTEESDSYFIQVFPPRSRILIIGAVHIAVELVQLARSFDFETIVIDPRKIFAQNTSFEYKPDVLYEKFPSEVLNSIPLDPYTYAVILSHDPKIDDDALKALLRQPVAYIGALGSKKNHEKRKARLLNLGFSESEISLIDAPIGVDIRAKGAREIALSIMGAIIAAKNRYL